MKKTLLSILAAAWLATAAYAEETCSKTSTRKSGETPTCLAFHEQEADGESAIIDTFGYKILSLVAWGDAATSVTLNIQCRYRSGDQGIEVLSAWKECAHDVIDPDATTNEEHALSLSTAYQYRIVATGYSLGTFHVMFDRRN